MKVLEFRNEEVLKEKGKKRKQKNFILESKKINLLVEKGKSELINPFNFFK